MICSTINRNPKSYLLAIIGAEYIMRWLPKGTHDYDKFITPEELTDMITDAGLDVNGLQGLCFLSASVGMGDVGFGYQRELCHRVRK